MKQLLTITAILLSLHTQAQTVHLDTSTHEYWAQVDTLYEWNSSTRLYFNYEKPMFMPVCASFTWSLRYARAIDSVTTHWIPAISQYQQVATPGNLTGTQAYTAVMRYIRDSVTYNGSRLNISFP